MTAWRLSRRRYAQDAFTGEGPLTYGGRWNPVGVPVVYASLSLSLAVLEVFVHMETRAEPEEYVSLGIDLGVSESSLERLNVDALPYDWRRLEHPALHVLGASWAQSKRSLGLLVPSVVVPEEWNVVLNPLHPDAKKMKIGKPRMFAFDERMFKPRD